MKTRFGRRLMTALGLAIVLPMQPAAADGLSWDQVVTPSPPPGRAIGGHARGCLGGAEALPLDGVGYQVMRPSRNRFYGHPATIAFLRELAELMQASGHAGLLIGDLGQPRGGPMLQGHRSHQTGLDVDIWFLSAPPWTLPLEEREVMAAPSMIDRSRSEVDLDRWTAEQVALLKTVAYFPEVDRVFVNPVLKRQLCQTVEQDRAWLAKIRPWWGHDDHLHVRLHCPGAEAECVEPSPPLPAGEGCDETLQWWFSEEAEQELRKSRAMPPHAPTLEELPPACRDLLFDDEADPLEAHGARS